MFLQISEFRRRVDKEMDNLVSELQALTRRYGFEEEKAWRASLPAVSRAFSDQSFDELDLYFGNNGNLGLEYRLPAAASWADMVLVGRHNKKPSAVIVELKNWITAGDRPGPVEGLMNRFNDNETHPSDQVRGYTEYCRRFHSAVADHGAAVHGCVVFTKDAHYGAYTLSPNSELTKQYPCFSTDLHDVKNRLPQYFKTVLTEPDHEFAASFEKGSYRQSRGFVTQIGQQILDRQDSPFVLLDNQRKAFAVVNASVSNLLKSRGKPKRTVIIIDGPPGSGKSVIAAKVWASLVTNPNLHEGNVVVTTTSASQSSNWQRLFEVASGVRGASGAIKKATAYTPITTGDFGSLRQKYPDAFNDESAWQENLKMLRSLKPDFRSGSRDDEYLVSIVDEAHALINPEHVNGRGQFGFSGAFGPQAYHIMRASIVTVFLLDTRQGFRDRENTTIDDIRQWATLLGITDDGFQTVSLDDSQFRCAGSKEYVDWVDSMLGFKPPAEGKNSQKMTNTFSSFTFEICDDPLSVEEALRSKIDQKNSVRLLASYARDWKTKGVARPHGIPSHMMDFNIPVIRHGKCEQWSKIWNFVPKGNDYTHFIQAPPGSRMETDPLAEIGCPYAVRGFDFDYVGLLWMEDLTWRDGGWQVNPDFVYESGISRLTGRAKQEQNTDGPSHALLLEAVQQAYRINLTRAMKGMYIWCGDQETREHLYKTLNFTKI